MGFYLRKSLKMGPVRVNLSKGGVGISGGVRGARIGVSSNGRAYVHAGRGGIYHRQSIGGSGRSRVGTARSASDHEPIVIVEDTGATYVPENRPRSESRLRKRVTRKKRPIARYHLLPVGSVLIFPFIATPGQGPALHGGLIFMALVLLIAWPIFVWRSWRSNRAGTTLGEALSKAISTGKPMTPEQIACIEETLQDPNITPEDRVYYPKIAYLEALRLVFEDQVISDVELELLAQCEHHFSLSKAFCEEARLDLFSAVFFEAVSDHDLSDEEEATLDYLRCALSIPESEITSEVKTIEDLKRLRMIRNGELPEIETGERLQKSERCHFENEGRMLKEKTLKRFQSEGEKYQVRGMVIDKEGTLLITNKRLLLVHDGTSAIQLDKISNIDVDYDQNLIIIAKEGIRSPTLVSTPDSLRAAAILASAAGF